MEFTGYETCSYPFDEEKLTEKSAAITSRMIGAVALACIAVVGVAVFY